ncbi:uncharacterized protein LOC131604720 [Vicia villosa]|uniref:uncharacterized protein LOC131604720 n=1 Tax=Vicia villosa TaxID=3911 RepID=UPI00273CD1A9|nr:uncharacterized protein LOC131604720 [Vicia villosa]
MEASRSLQKSYHDKRRKALEFEKDDHVFLRVTLVTGVGRALKLRKLTPRFIGLYQISERLKRYVADPSYVVQLDDVQVRDNLTVETSPIWIEDRKVKKLRGKEIDLVKVVWGGPADGNVTLEPEGRMKDSYPELFTSGVYQVTRDSCSPGNTPKSGCIRTIRDKLTLFLWEMSKKSVTPTGL